MYKGKLIKKLTPISNDPHIKMKSKRKIVLVLDRPPRERLFVNTCENQRAAATANIVLTIETTNMIKTAIRDPV